MGAEPRKSTTATVNSADSDARSEDDSADSANPAGKPETETPDSDAKPDAESAARRADRGAFAIAAAVLAACAGLVLYGILTTEDQPKPKAVPSAEVTYEVEGTGTADISYRALTASGKSDQATTATKVQLPWKKSVQVPLGKDPIVSITLGDKGGQARCALAIHGQHAQSATATGKFGRATCQGELPASTDGR